MISLDQLIGQHSKKDILNVLHYLLVRITIHSESKALLIDLFKKVKLGEENICHF